MTTHCTISKYNWVLLSGRTPWKSSQRRQRSAVFKGLAIISCRLLSFLSLSRSPWTSSSLPLKNFVMNSKASSKVNPSISSSVSQTFLTGIPASCRAVTTKWHLGSILPCMMSVNSGILLGGSSSNPSSTRRTLDWFRRMNSKNFSLSSLWTSRGKSWSSMASHTLDSTPTSRHLSNRTNSNCGKQSSPTCFFVAQS